MCQLYANNRTKILFIPGLMSRSRRTNATFGGDAATESTEIVEINSQAAATRYLQSERYLAENRHHRENG